MNERQLLGSNTAKGGFENEGDIVTKFNNYKTDKEAKLWLKLMGYDYLKIEELKATQIPPRINKEKALAYGATKSKVEETIKYKKADIQIKVDITIDNICYYENLSLKKANIGAGFNQIDKRKVNTYQEMWEFDNDIASTLKYYTGELAPYKDVNLLKDYRRMFMTEIEKQKVENLITFLSDNKIIIFTDLLKGRGALSADWFLVTRKNRKNGDVDWVLKDINYVCNFFSQGAVKITDRGNVKIGRITMQRKGGTPDPTSLQFKINPLDLFI